jgi:hypothetical protein
MSAIRFCANILPQCKNLLSEATLLVTPDVTFYQKDFVTLPYRSRPVCLCKIFFLDSKFTRILSYANIDVRKCSSNASESTVKYKLDVYIILTSEYSVFMYNEQMYNCYKQWLP